MASQKQEKQEKQSKGEVKTEAKKFPNEDEILLCTVTRIFPTTIFCSLEDYGREGVIPISEISPGRIRNVRDYVRENKRVVCKVLSVDRVKRHITLSLRRVSSKDRKEKLELHKKEKTAKLILQNFEKKSGLKVSEAKKEILRKKYGSVFDFFQNLIEDESKVREMVTEKKKSDILLGLVRERIKIKKVKVTAEVELKSYLPDGVERIKESLKFLKGKGVSVKYLGTPRYLVRVEGTNYKDCEKILKKNLEVLSQTFKKYGDITILNK